jgi:two-component system NarL family sensor kinase
LISVAVRVTGGLESDLWLLYFVLAISEGLFSSSPQTTLLSALMVGGYALGVWPDMSETGFWAAAITRMFFLVTVSSFGLRLSTDRVRRSNELARLKEQVAASDERGRIAREIHDSLGHALVSSILRLELAARLVRKKPDEAEQILQEETPALRAAWNEGRNLAFHLRPWEPDNAGFAAGLRKHVARFAERTGLVVDLRLSDSPWQLRPEVEVCVTRILQEALTNVAKHAQAEHVHIWLDEARGAVTLAIEDDGIGFDPQVLEHGFGLRAMRDRAENCGGSLTVSGADVQGVHIEAAIPAR